MTRPLNPELIGLTLQEKRKHYSRLYRDRTRDVYRKYQREYQQVLRNDPDYHTNVIKRRIEEIHNQKQKARAAADELIKQYDLELIQLQEKLNGKP